MNRYPRGGPSRASADTLCQKCLQRGHYSYECKASTTDRPYVARPSRTQQLLNPKFAPKLSEVAPPEDLTRKQGVADEILAAKEEERGRKRRRTDEDGNAASRSASESSVSTISTGRSRSPSPLEPPAKSRREDTNRKTRHSRSKRRERSHRRRRSPSLSSQSSENDGPREGRRGDARGRRAGSRARREPLVQRRSLRSPSLQRSRSRSPERSRERRPHVRYEDSLHETVPPQRRRPEEGRHPRERSLSPYSKRLALTQAMNR